MRALWLLFQCVQMEHQSSPPPVRTKVLAGRIVDVVASGGEAVWTIFVSVPDALLPFIEQRQRAWSIETDLLPLPGGKFALVVMYQVAATQFRLVLPLQGRRVSAFVHALAHQPLNVFFAETPGATGIGLRSRVETSFCESLARFCRSSSTDDDTLRELVLASRLVTELQTYTTVGRLPEPDVVYVAAIQEGAQQKSGLTAALESAPTCR